MKRILDTDDCYLFFITGAVMGMTYFTLTMLELISIVAICFWIQCKREYTPSPVVQNYDTGHIVQNQNNPQEVVIQVPQIIIVNQGNSGQYPQQNNINGNNLNQNNDKRTNNIPNNGNIIVYPLKQEIINNKEKTGQNNLDTITNKNQAINSNNKENNSERKGFY